MFPRKSLIVAAVLLRFAVASGEMTVTCELHPRKISLGEVADLQISLSGAQAAKPTFPEIDGIGFSQCSQMNQTTIIKGRLSQNLILSCQVLAQKPGTYTIEGITLVADRKKINVPAVSLEVVAGTGPKEVLVNLSISKPEPYVSEPVVLTFDWLFKKSIRDYEIRAPWFPPKDFLVVDPIQRRTQQGRVLPNPGEAPLEVNPQAHNKQDIFFQAGDIKHDGEPYKRYRFQRILTPIKPGEFLLEPTQIYCKVETGPKKGVGRDPFEDFGFGFQTRVRTKDVLATADALRFVVKPLPEEDRPADFSGAVGHFDLQVSLSPQKVKVGDPITVTMKVSGTGNFESVTCPRLGDPKGFRQYDAETKLSVEPTDTTFRGEKTFSKPLVPSDDTVKEIPAISFDFFDPERGTYQTLTRGPFPIEVSPESRDHSVGLVSAPEPGQRKLTIKPATGLFPLRKPSLSQFRNQASPFYLSPLFLAFLPFPALLCLVCYLFQNRRERLGNDVAFQRSQQALKKARQCLEAARAAQGPASYQKYAEALTGFVADKCNLPAAAVDSRSARIILSEKAVPKIVIDEFLAFLETCDQGRFGGSTPKSPPAEVLTRAEAILGFLKKNLP